MKALEDLRQGLPECAKDLKINLQSVLRGESLNDDQRWGVALASALACRQSKLRDATLADAKEHSSEAVVEDAHAAAALMGMNNIFYRFRHMINKDSYNKLPARLRMQRLAKPTTNKADFELYSLAVSMINGCEMCIAAHEKAVLDHGLSEQQIHDTARIASVFHGLATVLDFQD